MYTVGLYHSHVYTRSHTGTIPNQSDSKCDFMIINSPLFANLYTWVGRTLHIIGCRICVSSEFDLRSCILRSRWNRRNGARTGWSIPAVLPEPSYLPSHPIPQTCVQNKYTCIRHQSKNYESHEHWSGVLVQSGDIWLKSKSKLKSNDSWVDDKWDFTYVTKRHMLSQPVYFVDICQRQGVVTPSIVFKAPVVIYFRGSQISLV